MFGRMKRMLDQAMDRLEAKFEGISDDDVDRLIGAMREELVETKLRIPELESLMTSQLRQADDEKEKAEVADRRARKAEEIGDAETVEVARRFEAQHRQRMEVLVMKAEATRAELLQHRDEVEQMTAQLKEAIARRDSLGIQARRAKAVEGRASSYDAADAFDRMAERVEGAADLDDATREVDEALDPLLDERFKRDPTLDRAQREADAERMLRELKRRMGQEGP